MVYEKGRGQKVSYKYKEVEYDNLNLVKKLVSDYEICPECGSVGSSGRDGTMKYNNKQGKFERTCKCGWEAKVEIEKL